MPTITMNRKVFEDLVGKKLPEAELKDRISMLGTDLERLDTEIHLEIFPNRPDLLSEQGFARAFSSFIGVKPGLREYAVKRSDHKVIVENSVKDVRPYTAVAIVKGLKFDDEKIRQTIQIQEKLHITYGRNRKKVAIGIYPFEKIKTPIRFVGLPKEKIKFVPLESKKEMTANEILKNHPTGKEYGHLLKGLEKYPIFIDAKDNILSMPPIINSQSVGQVSASTKDVFIECSGFDYGVLSRCLNMIVCALADMGGQIYSMELDMYGKKIISPDLEPTEIDIDYPYIRSKLGFKITDAEIDESLMKMGFGIKSAKSSKLKKSGVALVPCYRADILHQIDLVEDVAIGYGYENIPEHIPKVATIGKEDSFEILKRKISEILIGLNNLECKTYMIANKDYQTKKMNCNMDIVELSNALNEDYNVLNYWLIPQLFEVLKNNKHNEYPQNIYTISTVFSKEQMPVKSDTGMVETDKLALLLCSENSDYTRALQQFDYLMRMLGKKYELRQGSHDSFIPGRVSFAYVNGKNIGFIGEISIEVLRNWQIEMPVCGFEIDLNKLDS